MGKCDLTFARHDLLLCLTPGLFRSVKKGEKGSQQLNVSHKFREKIQARFWGPQLLGADDMRVLQGLIAMAGRYGQILGAKPESRLGESLRKQLRIRGVAQTADAIAVTTTYTKLAMEIGYAGFDGGRLVRQLRQSITRLLRVYVAITGGENASAFRMMSLVQGDKASKLSFALNPRLAASILDDRQHARIDLNEVRKLRTDQARLIHQRLSAWVNVGRTARIAFRSFEGYIWGDADSTGSTLRMRRSAVRQALLEIVGLGWGISECEKGVYEVRRPFSRSKSPKATRTNVDVPPAYH